MHLDATAFRSFFLCEPYDGMLKASPGRQWQRHRTHATHAMHDDASRALALN